MSIKSYNEFISGHGSSIRTRFIPMTREKYEEAIKSGKLPPAMKTYPQNDPSKILGEWVASDVDEYVSHTPYRESLEDQRHTDQRMKSMKEGINTVLGTDDYTKLEEKPKRKFWEYLLPMTYIQMIIDWIRNLKGSEKVLSKEEKTYKISERDSYDKR